jgi:hypothetical protein
VEATLKNLTFDAIYESQYPRIKGGLLVGFCEYLEDHTPKARLRVFFPIIPQYIITEQNDKPTCDISAVEIEEEDIAALTKAEPRCIYRAKDQTGCPMDRIRCFCNSWVGALFRL